MSRVMIMEHAATSGRSRAVRFRARASLAAVAMLLTLSGCGQEATVPDVVGVQLDDAHNQLMELSFEEFEDEDLFEDRGILLDSNWVVLEQEPAAGESAGTGTTITLRVGKIGESRTTERLPEDSPVLAEIRADEAEAADEKNKEREAETAERARKAAEQATSVAAYVNDVDPLLRLAQSDLHQLAVVGAEVRSGELGGDALLIELVDARVALGNYREQLQDRKPDGKADRDDAHDALLSSLETFDQALMTLLSAEGPGRAANLQRFDDVYVGARDSWNSALQAVYESTTVAAPVLA